VSVLRAGIRGGGGAAVLSALLPLLLPDYNPAAAGVAGGGGIVGDVGDAAAARAAAAAAAAAVAASAEKLAGTIEECASVGAFKLVETLMAVPGVDKLRNVFGCSVHRAVEQGDMKMLRRLLLMGASVQSVTRPSGTEEGGGWGVLHFAAAVGDVDVMDYVLQRGCEKEINLQDYGGFTALHVAVHRGNYECVRLLLMKGANHSVRSGGGLSALHIVIARGDTTMLQVNTNT